MTHSELLRIEARNGDISIAMRGTCFRIKYRVEAPRWLIVQEQGPDDPGAPISIFEFRKLAWEAAMEKASELGWLNSQQNVQTDAADETRVA
jgi:hypothetical protein